MKVLGAWTIVLGLNYFVFYHVSFDSRLKLVRSFEKEYCLRELCMFVRIRNNVKEITKILENDVYKQAWI